MKNKKHGLDCATADRKNWCSKCRLLPYISESNEMKNTRSKWEKEFEMMTHEIVENGGFITIDGDLNDATERAYKNIKAFILSTLQEYAELIAKEVIGKDRELTVDAVVFGEPGKVYDSSILKLVNKLRRQQRQALHKLNTTYGLKKKGE